MRKSFMFLHWGLTIFLTPFISQIIGYIFGNDPHRVVGLLEVYPITFLFSIVFSIPTFVIYYLSFSLLARNKIRLLLSKIILMSLTVLGIYTTQRLIDGNMSKDIVVSYSITSIFVGLSLRLKKIERKMQNKQIGI